ncbi:putative heme iron utilization protein [Prochlorococcus marinus str. SS51]|nr:putative heme iron utilization protein [Prochlorococcus marinus str. SS51]
MLEITSLWMKLKVDGNDLQIPFDHTLIDSSDAHKTLVSMSKSIPE